MLGSRGRVADNSQQNCLIAGPTGAGKTAFLGALWHACADTAGGAFDVALGFGPEMARLSGTQISKAVEGQGLDATVTTKQYQFTVTVDERDPNTHEILRPHGVSAFSCMDGPGGALFTTNFQPDSLPSDMQEYRKELVAAGQSATALVFVIDSMTDAVRSFLAGNLPYVLGDLAVKLPVPVADPRLVSGIPLLKRIWPWKNGNHHHLESYLVDDKKFAYKLSADRVVFVLNRIDQVCLHWQEEWRQNDDRRKNWSVLQIAEAFARPLPLAYHVLGKRFFHQVRGFLKPGAKMAVAICSAGGFDRDSGDPCLDATGRPNRMDGLDPRTQEGRVKHYGVREAILFAGFGIIENRNVVEEITYERLVSADEDRN